MCLNLEEHYRPLSVQKAGGCPSYEALVHHGTHSKSVPYSVLRLFILFVLLYSSTGGTAVLLLSCIVCLAFNLTI